MERFDAMAQTDPADVIVQVYGEVEHEIRTRLESAGVERSHIEGMGKVARGGLEAGILTQATSDAIYGLMKLHRLTVLYPETATPQRAVDFLALADAIMRAVDANVSVFRGMRAAAQSAESDPPS
jgi:hypothetical protein